MTLPERLRLLSEGMPHTVEKVMLEAAHHIDNSESTYSQRRDMFAAAALQGMLAKELGEHSMSPAEWAHDAVAYADALIAELDRSKP